MRAKVRRGVRLPLQDEVHEGLFFLTRCAQGRIEADFVANGAAGNGRQCFSAHASGAVAGPDTQVFGQTEYALRGGVEMAGCRLHRIGFSDRRLQKVGPPKVSYKNEIARENPHRFVGARTPVGDFKRKVFGGVTGCVQGAEVHFPDTEAVTVPQQGDRAAVVRPLVLPTRSALARQVGAAPVTLDEFPASRKEVRVNVCFDHRYDPEVLAMRALHIAVDVALRVNDKGLAGAPASHQIGVLCELRVADLPQNHDSVPPIFSARTARAKY